tara:strand:- start:1697 stop:1912 length:216 start_codon:yes stop_codon:yes gene_type:complete
MMKTRKALYLSLVVLLVVFVIQNIALVTVGFLFWEITLPRSVIIAVAFCIGIIIGLGLRELLSRKNKINGQ